MAAGTVTQTWDDWGHIKKWTCAWVGGTTGDVPATTSTKPIQGYLYKLITNPGATKPSANYDVTMVDPQSFDVLHGAGYNKSTSDTECAHVWHTSSTGTTYTIGASYHHPIVSDKLVFTLSGNTTGFASTGDVILYYGMI